MILNEILSVLSLSLIQLNIVTLVHLALTYQTCFNLRKKALGMQTLVDLVIIHTLVVQSANIIGYVAIYHLAILTDEPVNETIANCVTILVNTLTIISCMFYLFAVLIKVGKQNLSCNIFLEIQS